MPSPFKEAEKRKTQPGYKDAKRRLWVTVAMGPTGRPSLVWQCWWSKGRGGKGKGGHTAYPMSVLTKVPMDTIHKLLDLDVDEAVEQAETLEDKLLAIATQNEREADARVKMREQPRAQRQPWPSPPTLVPLFAGSPLSRGGESMVLDRKISENMARLYQLSWDCDCFKIFLPWLDKAGSLQLGQWWDGVSYRFPPKDGIHLQKEDAIFGLHFWTPERPLILGEGCFSAMSVYGQALGGSSLTDRQLAIILSLSPKVIILAFDNDQAGYSGASSILRVLEQSLPGCEVHIAFPPKGFNDWNDVLKAIGETETLRIFAEVYNRSRQLGALSVLMEAYAA